MSSFSLLSSLLFYISSSLSPIIILFFVCPRHQKRETMASTTHRILSRLRHRCTRVVAPGRHARAVCRRRVQGEETMQTWCKHGTNGRVHVTSRREVARPAVAETTATAAAAAASTAGVAAKSTMTAAAVTGATVPLVWLRALIGIATVAVIIFQGSHVTLARTQTHRPAHKSGTINSVRTHTCV